MTCPTAHREVQIQTQSEGQIQNPIAKTPALALYSTASCGVFIAI